jgi:glycosyltransferase involved in cell wall biosynthesis
MGTRDILAPQKGALVAEDNIDHFSSQVIAILSDQNLHQRLAAEAREYAMQWSATAMASQQLALYQEVINLSSSHKTSNAVIEIQSSTHESQHNKT